MGTATCYLTWSQLPFRFCLVLELQGVPNSMRPALIRFLGLAGEKGSARKKSIRDALPRVNTSWSYRVNVHRLVFPLVDTQLFIWRCSISTIKIPRELMRASSPKTRKFWLEGVHAVGGLPTQLEDLVQPIPIGADQVRARALTHTPAVPTAVTDGMVLGCNGTRRRKQGRGVPFSSTFS